MPKRSLPYFFLAFLFSILLFILGTRYGQQVELANKTIRYLISIPPTPTLQPTTLPLSFSDYTHSGCAISFLIPSSLEKTKESSASALFVDIKKQLAIAVSCEKKPYLQEKNEVVYTINRTIRAYQTTTNDTISYRFFNAKNMKVITITTSKKYLPLINTSLILIP